MKSSKTTSFRSRFEALSLATRALVRKNFQLWLRDSRPPSIQFKKVGRYLSARVGNDFPARAIMTGKRVDWFWIGRHDEYEQIIGRR